MSREVTLELARDPGGGRVVLEESDWNYVRTVASLQGHNLAHDEVVPPYDCRLLAQALRRWEASLGADARKAKRTERVRRVLALLGREEGVLLTWRQKT
jgi:hypothetical protein